MSQLYLYLRNLLKSEEGQDLIEYALLVVFIAIIVMVVLPLVGTQISTVFEQIKSQLESGIT